MNPPGYVQHACIDKTCGVTYLVPDHIHQQALRLGDKRTVYCPNGHMWHYTKSEADTLREENERLKKQVADLVELRAARSADLKRAERTAIYWKGIAHRRKR